MNNALIYELDGVISSQAPINMWASKTIIHKNLDIHVVIIIQWIVGHPSHSQRHGFYQNKRCDLNEWFQ
jgi:hypothetical protein